ncbi:Os07g0207301, partial [Oryza sativa Japonica Group]
LGGAARRGEDVLDAGELEHLLGHVRRHDPGPPGRRHHAHGDGAALAGDLARHGVRLPDLVPPVPPPHGHDGELGEDDGAADRRCDLLGALDAEPDVAVAVADDDERLEPRALPGARLLLHRRDLHHLVLEARHELLHDLVLLDGEGVEVDLLDLVDLVLLHEAPQLGHGHPLLLLL